jgi:cytochrome bd-type quinol oxidase subunit 1
VFVTQGKTKHVGAAFSGELPAFFSSALFIKSFVYLWKNLKGKRFQYISSQNKYN